MAQELIPMNRFRQPMYVTRAGTTTLFLLSQFLAPIDCSKITARARTRAFKLLGSPGINFKETIPPASEPRWPVRQPYSYSVPSAHRLF